MKLDTEMMLAELGAGEMSAPQPTRTTSATNKQGKGISSSIEEQALDLLGQGIDPVVVANALGVAPGRISQLLSNEEFSKRVVERRFKALAANTERDGKYDSLEDSLISKLESTIPFMVKTQDILRALQTVNNAKRRGQAAPQSLTSTDNIVPLIMPKIVIEKFTAVTNQVNQVVRADNQDLVTIQSGTLMDKIKQKQIDRQEDKPEQALIPAAKER